MFSNTLGDTIPRKLGLEFWENLARHAFLEEERICIFMNESTTNRRKDPSRGRRLRPRSIIPRPFSPRNFRDFRSVPWHGRQDPTLPRSIHPEQTITRCQHRRSDSHADTLTGRVYPSEQIFDPEDERWLGSGWLMDFGGLRGSTTPRRHVSAFSKREWD